MEPLKIIHTHTQTTLRWKNEILQFHPPNFVFFTTVAFMTPSFIYELCFYQSFSKKKYFRVIRTLGVLIVFI